MRIQYGVTIIALATAFTASLPAFAENMQGEFGPKKDSPQWQMESVKKLPPDIIMDSTPGSHQSALEKLPMQPNLWSGKSFRSGIHK